MKTIAITIDDASLKRLDHLVASQESAWRSRSELVRQALRDFLDCIEREREEKRETEVFRLHRDRLRRQAAALVKDQAEL